MLTAIVAVVLLGALPSSATAQNADGEARELFRAGEAAYARGRYDAALERFREAHALSGRALLLFNIGQCLDRLRRDDEALETFEQYLTSEPEGPHHVDVQRRVVALRRAIAERRAREDEERMRRDADANASRASTAAATDAPSNVLGEWWFWTLIGAAAVAVVVPIVIVTTSSAGPAPVAGDFGPDGVIVALDVAL